MTRKKKVSLLEIGVCLIIVLLLGFNRDLVVVEDTKKTDNLVTQKSDNLKVHFIDVGQGDCFLLQQDKYNMLIDSGSSSKSNDVISYLKSNGVDNIDVVIATHMDSDHMGGLVDIGKSINFATIFYYEDKTKDNVTEQKFLNFLQDKNAIQPKIGDIYDLGSIEYCFLAPNNIEDNNESNDYSIVTKVTYKGTSFLFMADADKNEEQEIMNTVPKNILQSSVLKIAHHGSKYSTSDEFLDIVTPVYAVICVGENQYGHPTYDILSKLEKKNIKTFRTDVDGTILFTSDGINIQVDTIK